MTAPSGGLILVAEDDPILRRLAEVAIAEAGFSVLAAEDGEEAVRVYGQRAAEIRCVVLDLTMPKLDGMEVFRQLRRIKADVPVIVSTGYGDEEAVEQLAGLGVAALLEKPYRLDRLIEVLHKVAAAAVPDAAACHDYIARAPVAILVFDAAGRYTEVNPAATRISGYAEKEMLGTSFLDLLADESREAGREHFARLKQFGHASGEMAWFRKDGVKRCSIFDAVQLADDRFIAYLHDVTDLRRMEQALRREKSFSDAIIHGVAEGLCVCHATPDDPYVAFTVWNDRMTEITGYTMEEINRKGWYQAVYSDPDVRRRAAERMARMREGEDILGEEWEITRADGGTRIVSISTSILVGEDGQRHALAVMQDVTKRRRAEQEKLEMERRLLQAQKLESLGILAGGIAHDFNNILAGIMGYADLARRRLAEHEPARADLEVIAQAVQRAADLTRQMLAYSGKGKFLVDRLDLSRLVEDNRQILAMSVSKQAVLDYRLAPDLPPIHADASQMHQVLLNLVLNASESLGDAPGRIAISTDAVRLTAADAGLIHDDGERPEGLYVRLEVADTGCGVDPATRAKIFDPFFTTKFTGRGLGLAAVHGIVRGHRGAIRVQSEPGKGTVFQAFFPTEYPAHAVCRP